MASRALGQVGAVASLRELPRLHEESRRRLLRNAAGLLRPGRALRRAHGPLVRNKLAGRDEAQAAPLVLSLISGNSAIVRGTISAAAAAATGVIVISGLTHSPSQLARKQEEEEEESEGSEHGREGR